VKSLQPSLEKSASSKYTLSAAWPATSPSDRITAVKNVVLVMIAKNRVRIYNSSAKRTPATKTNYFRKWLVQQQTID
jgi:hypothetical protein